MAALQLERQCTLLVGTDDSTVVSESDLAKRLESKNDDDKIKALKELILATLQGENFPRLRMHVIKYCINTRNKTLKKLLLNYWEVVEKRDDEGKPLHEMILVCQAMKNDLDHPNEYIRGCTLRFLSKLKEPTILESLIPSITANLSHRHSFVRKNAVLTVFAIYQAFPDLIPDAPDLITTFLGEEKNPQAKKNAFLMLSNCSQIKAMQHLDSILDDLPSQAENFQLVALDLIRKACHANPTLKGKYIRAVFTLVNSNSNAVAYQGANTLVALSTAPTAVKAAVQAYTSLLKKESDTNVKLVIVNRVASLKRKNAQVLSTMVMDIIRSLSSPNLDLRRTTLNLAISLVNNRNVEQVVGVLKKEMVKTDSPTYDGAVEYRRLLVDALHDCAVKFPSVVSSVASLLMNYLTEDPVQTGSHSSSKKTGADEEGRRSSQTAPNKPNKPRATLSVVDFLREICEEYPEMSETILNKLLESLTEIRVAYVARVALWIIGEYSLQPAALDMALSTLRSAVGQLPLMMEETIKLDADGLPEESKATSPQVLADGTYASQSKAVEVKTTTTGAEEVAGAPRGLRQLLLSPDYFLASTLAVSLTKLVIRYVALAGGDSPEVNEEKAKALQLLVSIMRMGELHKVKKMDKDSADRVRHCIHLLLSGDAAQQKLFLHTSRSLFKDLLDIQREKKAASERKSKEMDSKENTQQADQLISIRQLKGIGFDEEVDDEDADLSRAVGSGLSMIKTSKLERIYQLTGFADAVYCEAQLKVFDYNIVLDFALLNQTDKVLQNLAVELHASGELRVMDKISPIMLKPRGVHKVKINIKVASTDSGVIFGNLVFDSLTGSEKQLLTLANIRMDIMDYIVPATCSERAFRSMWAEFEWENKIAVNTEIQDLNQFLDHILDITNMTCQTPRDYLGDSKKPALHEDPATGLQEGASSNFLAANLYAKSMFGECALLNVSVERNPSTGRIVGYYRIRTKTQGIALSLGDRITSRQRSLQAGANGGDR
eukprot:gb/GEZN01001118.1/.p1 GENE.gb/GEZN01001118.1/~~gb/GEZN01001118.1/.p1  ORF type:complete len:1003 (+),score=201.18 gb/GEZN01001118.1/:53-3061(+)